jgi:hypothetical protein
MALSARVHLGWVVWSMERENGDEFEERTDGILRQSASSVRLLIFITLIFPYCLYYISDGAAYPTQRRNRNRLMFCRSTRSTLSSYLLLQLPTARSTVQLHWHAIRLCSYPSRTHSTVTGSSFLQGGVARAKSRSYEMALMRSVGRGVGTRPLVRVGIDHGGSGAGTRNSTRRSCRIQGLR